MGVKGPLEGNKQLLQVYHYWHEIRLFNNVIFLEIVVYESYACRKLNYVHIKDVRKQFSNSVGIHQIFLSLFDN